jgi:aldose 1-epimerase
MIASNRPDVLTLTNALGMELEVMSHGATVKALRVPDRDGGLDDVVLGFDDPASYLGPHPYFGGIVGRYANRIANGRFRLDGGEYNLTTNDGLHHLHGGPRGFDRRRWTAEAAATDGDPVLRLRYTSADGEEGYPGRLDVQVTYALTRAGEFRIEYEASTDRPTILNLTHHSYFNLEGSQATDILGHELQVDADTFTPVDEGLIPTGERRDVTGTPFDLRRPRPIGEAMKAAEPQLERGHGYDHNFVLRPPEPSMQPRRAARLVAPRSGRVMEVRTTEPGLQLYTGGALDGSIAGKNGRRYGKHAGLCLETQHFPDSPNRPEFPSTRLDPGQVFRSLTVHRFSTTP